MNILRPTIIILALIGISNSKILNKTILLEKYGYSTDAVHIDLSEQSISSIDLATFDGFNKLEILHLEDNKLMKIESGLFDGLKNLREIWLETNNIVSLDKNIFEGSFNLELVCFYDNPISFLFPDSLAKICVNNLKCVIKILEKCSKKSMNSSHLTLTFVVEIVIAFLLFFFNYSFKSDH